MMSKSFGTKIRVLKLTVHPVLFRYGVVGAPRNRFQLAWQNAKCGSVVVVFFNQSNVHYVIVVKIANTKCFECEVYV